MKRQKRIIRRTKATTQGRGTKASSKSRKRQAPTVKARTKRKPPRKAKRTRNPKRIASRGLPRKGMSPTFRQFVEAPRKGKARETYAMVELQFVYGRSKRTFRIPLKLGFRTKAQIAKITFEDIEEELSLTPISNRGELVRVKGFAQLKARKFRKGKTIRKTKARKPRRAKKGRR